MTYTYLAGDDPAESTSRSAPDQAGGTQEGEEDGGADEDHDSESTQHPSADPLQNP